MKVSAVWRWREEEKEEAGSCQSMVRYHRNVKALVILIEDSLQKVQGIHMQIQSQYL